MKRNILTIIIMAIVLINTVLSAVLVFVIVPASNKTNQLVTKVASIVDLELESPKGVAVEDIVNYAFADPLTINLKQSDDKDHYALVPISLSMNSKHLDYSKYYARMAEYENPIEEIVTEEFGKYTKDDVTAHKEDIKKAILTRIKELFKSDFVIDITFGNILLS